MKSLIFGIILTTVAVILSVEGGIDAYMQKHSIILVIGGTIAIFFFATPDKSIKLTWQAFIKLFRKEERFEDYHAELESLARSKTLASPSNNKLINYAAELWEQGIDPNLFIVLVSQKKMEIENDTSDALQTLKNLSKYPPGLGITGTVMGMIALFSQIDSNKDNVGASIALAMTATFFGLFLTNIIIAPIADRIQIRYLNRKRMFSNIYKVLLLINQDEPDAIINNELEVERVA